MTKLLSSPTPSGIVIIRERVREARRPQEKEENPLCRCSKRTAEETASPHLHVWFKGRHPSWVNVRV